MLSTIFREMIQLAEKHGTVKDVMFKETERECAVTFINNGKTHELYYSEKMEGDSDAIQN